MGYYYDDERSWIKVLLVGAAAGAVLVGLVWAGTWWFSSHDPDPRRATLQSGAAVNQPARGGTGASEPSQDTSELSLCRSVYDEQRAPLRAAADSLSQWEVHVGAMNQLVVGAITLPQATQFWNRTRVGAHAKLQDFGAARTHYGQRVFRCPSPRPGAEATSDLQTCQRAVAARGRELRLATVALGTWAQHVRHMEMLRRGEMTPQRATEMWLQSWRAGDREIAAYRAAARTAERLHC